MSTVQFRLNRLFRSGKCLDVAIDHAGFGEPAFLEGLEDMEAVVRLLAAAGADAIQMNYGQCDLLWRLPGPKPALVMRLDTGNPYRAPLERPLYDMLAHEPDPVLPAVQMDAACVVCNLLSVPGEPDLHRQTLSNISRIRPLAERYGMPLMVEPLALAPDEQRGGLRSDGLRQRIVTLVRQARELGADVIKADPPEHLDDFHSVVEAARCPVLVRGGGREAVEAVFRKAEAYLAQGAAGLVYGRNVFQHQKPARMVRALLALIHDGARAGEAAALYGGV